MKLDQSSFILPKTKDELVSTNRNDETHLSGPTLHNRRTSEGGDFGTEHGEASQMVLDARRFQTR